jgi:hypothetical protein
MLQELRQYRRYQHWSTIPDTADDSEDEAGDDEAVVPVTLSGMAAELDAEMGGALAAFLTENHKTFRDGIHDADTPFDDTWIYQKQTLRSRGVGNSA